MHSPMRSVWAGLPGSPSYRGTFADPEGVHAPTPASPLTQGVPTVEQPSNSPLPLTPPRDAVGMTPPGVFNVMGLTPQTLQPPHNHHNNPYMVHSPHAHLQQQLTSAWARNASPQVQRPSGPPGVPPGTPPISGNMFNRHPSPVPSTPQPAQPQTSMTAGTPRNTFNNPPQRSPQTPQSPPAVSSALLATQMQSMPLSIQQQPQQGGGQPLVMNPQMSQMSPMGIPMSIVNPQMSPGAMNSSGMNQMQMPMSPMGMPMSPMGMPAPLSPQMVIQQVVSPPNQSSLKGNSLINNVQFYSSPTRSQQQTRMNNIQSMEYRNTSPLPGVHGRACVQHTPGHTPGGSTDLKWQGTVGMGRRNSGSGLGTQPPSSKNSTTGTGHSMLHDKDVLRAKAATGSVLNSAADWGQTQTTKTPTSLGKSFSTSSSSSDSSFGEKVPPSLKEEAREVIARSLRQDHGSDRERERVREHRHRDRDQDSNNSRDKDSLTSSATSSHKLDDNKKGVSTEYLNLLESIDAQAHATAHLKTELENAQGQCEGDLLGHTVTLNEEFHEAEFIKRQLQTKTAQLEQAKVRAETMTRNLEMMQKELNDQREQERLDEIAECNRLEMEMDRLANEETKLRHHSLKRLRDRAYQISKARTDLQEEKTAIERARLEVQRNMEEQEKQLATKEADLEVLEKTHKEEIEGVTHRRELIEYYLAECKSLVPHRSQLITQGLKMLLDSSPNNKSLDDAPEY